MTEYRFAARKVAVGVLYFGSRKGIEATGQHIAVGSQTSSDGRARPLSGRGQRFEAFVGIKTQKPAPAVCDKGA